MPFVPLNLLYVLSLLAPALLLGWLVLLSQHFSLRRLVRTQAAYIRQLKRELEQVLVDRTESLRSELETRSQLEAAVGDQRRHEAISKLTGGVAHDFNNLLTAVLNTNQFLRHSSGHAWTPKELEMLDVSDQVARSGAEIVRALLSYTRHPASKESSLVLLDYLLRQRSLFRSVVGESVVIEEQWLIPPEAAVRADEAHLTTALINLLSNARDALLARGTIVLRCELLPIDVPGESPWPEVAPGCYACLQVLDSGCGMAPEELARAFEPYFTTKPPELGTGLGLSAVLDFARRCRGDARIDSPGPGCGCRAELLLPLSNPPPAGTSVATTPQQNMAQGQTLLVVEDNDQVRRATVQLLTLKGFQVESVASADQAIERLEHGAPPCVVLSDVRMPGEKDGVDLARWLNARHPQVRVVLCSGYSLAHAEPGFMLLPKPYTVEELIAACLGQERHTAT
jgi:two-component system, NtrC family, sensor kinase